MTVETIAFISDFNTALPAAGDLKSEGDDHIRGIKTGTKGTFPNLVGAASPGSMGTSLGLVGTPAYSFAGDADTGMWSPAANTMAWSVNGAESYRISTLGFGIGGAPSSGTRLNITSSNTTTTAGGTTDFGVRITSSGAGADTSVQLTDGSVWASIWGVAGAGAAAEMYWSHSGTSSFTKRLALTSDGRLYGTALHNNAGAVTGTTNQYLGSGTYTPTLTSVANVAASTARQSQWMRVGNVVTVSGQFDMTATASGTVNTEIDMSLPIASNFSTAFQLGGSANGYLAGTGSFFGMMIDGDSTNKRARLRTSTSFNSSTSFSFTFSYEVV